MLSQADRDYIRSNFVALDDLCRARGEDAEEVRAAFAAGRLPKPAYVLDDGTEFVARDYFALRDAAGGIDRLPAAFAERYGDAAAREAEELDPPEAEWQAYLSGEYAVCLHQVTPENIARKVALMKRIERLLEDERPDDTAWREELREAVGELDSLERPFAEYDRVRFGGPVSRDRLIAAVRERYPAVFSDRVVA